MNRFFTLLLAASCLTAVGQTGYCLEGTVWDSDLGGCVSQNSADINNDGCVQLNDLLDLLGAYNGCADEQSSWQCGESLRYQGYNYETVQMGQNCWFAENLIVSETEGGTEIEILGEEAWPSSTLGPNDYPCVRRVISGSNILYTWNCTSVIDNICPSGWRVPTRENFLELVEFVEGTFPSDLQSFPSSEDIKSLEWGNNSTGFNLLPNGKITSSGNFQQFDFVDGNPWSMLWSSTVDSHPSQSFFGGSPFQIWEEDGDHNLGGSDWGTAGGGIRCIKD